MSNHKHCKNCGYIIIPSEEYPKLQTREEMFKRDIAYGNGFCEMCMNEYGLDALCNFYKRIHNE